MIQAVRTIFKKELLDSIRDRRSYMAAFVFSVVPALMVVMFYFMLLDKVATTKPVEVKITGAEHAPALVAHLNSQEISQGWDQKSQIALTIPEDFQQKLNAGERVSVTVQADYSDKSARAKLSRIHQAVNAYSQELASLRLVARGIDPQIVSPISVKQQDISTPKAKSAMLMGVVVIMMIQAAFIAGMNVAIDSSSGERERNSLELLLSHPISTYNIALGKILNASLFAAVGVSLSVLFSVIAFAYVPMYKVGFTTDLSILQAINMILICLPVAFLASTIQVYVSFQAKSFKEAQIYVTYTQFLPMLFLMGQVMMEWDFFGVTFLPLIGQADALNTIIKGQSVDMLGIMISQIDTVAITIGLVALVGKMLKSEKTVFGL